MAAPHRPDRHADAVDRGGLASAAARRRTRSRARVAGGGRRRRRARPAPRPASPAAGRAARSSPRRDRSTTRPRRSSGRAASAPPSRCASAGIAFESSASRPRRPKRPGRRGTRIPTSKATLPRAPGASGTLSASGTAVQWTASLPATAPATLPIVTGRRPPQPDAAVAPEPDPDPAQRRRAGVGDRQRLAPGPAQPAVAAPQRDVVGGRGRVRLARVRGRGEQAEQEQRRERRPDGHSSTRITSVRGPWTPSTRSSSMSDVALGPETNVSGRPSAAAGASAAIASGTEAWMRAASTRQTWKSGHERQRAAAALVAAVEHDGAGLGDRERAAREHAVDLVEPARRDRRVVDQQLEARARAAARRAGRRAGGRPARGTPRRPRPRRPPPAIAPDGGLVVARALAEARDDRLAAGRRAAAGDVVVARDLRHDARRRRARRGSAPRTSSRAPSCRRPAVRAARGVGARRGRRGRRAAAHHSRNDCCGTSGSSRIAVQPDVPGRWRASGPLPARASRCARS